MKRYKLRAECLGDITEFLDRHAKTGNIEPKNIQWVAPPLPDVEFTFESTSTKSQLITLLKSVPDSHVMKDTLESEEKYTGERKFLY